MILKFTVIATIVVLAGCAATSVSELGPDTYLVSKRAGSGFASTWGLTPKALDEAKGYCAKMNREMQVVRMSEQSGGPGRYPRADIQFMCLEEGDPELARPKLRKEPDTVIEVQQ